MLLFGTAVDGQTGCPLASGKVVERRDTFTIFSITLPSQLSSMPAIAVVSNSKHRAGAYVFTLSKLIASDSPRSTEMLPAAIHLANEGHSSILLERVLTAPNIDDSVGHTNPQALCAEQWLSTHASAKPDDWAFIGPDEDMPSFDQLHEAGDRTSRTFYWGLSVAGYSETRNTENVLRDGIVKTVDAITQSHQQAMK